MSYPPPHAHPLASLTAAAAHAHSFTSSASSSTSTSGFLHHPAASLATLGHGGQMVQSPDAGSTPPGLGQQEQQEGPVGKKRRVASGSNLNDGVGSSAGIGEAGRGTMGQAQAGGKGEAKKKGPLSCSECKCDRKIPCLACCKRGDPSSCNFTDDPLPVKEPDVQPFALTTDLVKLATRLQALEEWAGALPPELRAKAPPPLPQKFQPEVYGNKVKQSTREKLNSAAGSAQAVEGAASGSRCTQRRHDSATMDEQDEEYPGPSSRDMSDTEDAAVKLESIAFSARIPNSNYRPQDSLPFFDNIPSGLASANTAPARPTTAVGCNAELTSMRTSILAPPLVYEGPWSASALGLEMCFSLDELRRSRRRVLNRLWPFLPGQNLSGKLVEKYFLEVAILHNVFHRPSFQAEHERAWEMIAAGRRDEIDPMWLSGYCMVLALAVDGLRCEEPRIHLTPEEQQRCHPLLWYACAQRFSQIGDGSGRPQVRFIQTVILIGQWLQTSAVSGQATRFLSLLASAIRTAQVLGLHQLSDDPSHMPPCDPAWPPNACSVRRELALRLFSLLSFYDYMSATTRFRCYILDPLQCTTPPVSNLNYDQLSITDWRIEPHPRNVLTDSSFEYAKICICRASRGALQKLVASTSSFSYDTVLELDEQYRKVLAEVERAMPSPGHQLEEASHRWKCNACLEGIYSRLLRLHRPFMAKNEYSRKCCLESAEKVIRSDLAIISVTNNAWFTYSHALAAAICLFSDLFLAIDQDLPEKEIEAKKEILVLAFEVFGRSDDIVSPQLRFVVQTGSKILSGLFMAEEKRRVSRAASTLVDGTRSSEPALESFAAVLQRLTEEVSASAMPQPSPAAPPASTLPPVHFALQSPALAATGFPPFGNAAPPLSSSMFATPYDPSAAPSLQSFDFSFPGSNAESYMPSEFFRDVGLVGPSSLGLGGSNGFEMRPSSTVSSGLPYGATTAAEAGLPTMPLEPSQLGGAEPDAGAFSNPFYTPPVGIEWMFRGGGSGGAEGGESSKLAANALLDQLAGGVW
ncbi:hypothetical protein JCM11641_001125 [Rhodosporidiobolus odoratus]